MARGKAIGAAVTAALLAASGVWAAHDSIISSFPTPAEYTEGLAYDGTQLYLASTSLPLVWRINPVTGSVIASYTPAPLPLGVITGLAYQGGYLWLGVYSGAGATLCRANPTTGSVSASYNVPGVTICDGIAADANYLYVSNNFATNPRLFKFSPGAGSVVASWTVYTKYPGGLDIITHVPTSTQVLLNVGNVDGWTYVYDLNGVYRSGEEFLIDAPCSTTHFVGDLATVDSTHFYFSSDEMGYIYYESLDWYGQEFPGVAPTTFGKIKALYR